MKILQKNSSFNQIPTFLMDDPMYNDISNDAKILYSLLLSRHRLSKINHQKDVSQWKDERGIYIIFSRENMASMLHCSVRKVPSIIAELKLKGLIAEKRMGQGKSNRIYIYESQQITLKQTTAKNTDLDRRDDTDLDQQKLHTNKIKLNKINNNHSIIQTKRIIERENIRKQIDYDSFFLKINTSREDELIWHKKLTLIDQLIEVMIQIHQAPNHFQYKIKGINYSAKHIKQEILQVNKDCIDYICYNLLKTNPIYNMNAYMITTLFTAPSTYKWSWKLIQENKLKETFKNKSPSQVANADQNQKICKKLDDFIKTSTLSNRFDTDLQDAYQYVYAVIQQLYLCQVDILDINHKTIYVNQYQRRIDVLQIDDFENMVLNLRNEWLQLRYFKDSVFDLVIKHLSLIDYEIAL